MFRLFTPVLILQVFCIYHVYKNKRESWWIWIILIFPLIGSAIYLYKEFYSKKSVENLAEGVKSTINTNYTITKLEKELKFSDTVENKIKVANKYVDIGLYDQAFDLYNSCLKGIFSNDQDLLMKLTKTSYLKEDYVAAIKYGSCIKKSREFNKSEEKIALAWSYHYTEDDSKAKDLFNEMDIQFDNYKHRTEFIKFLIKKDETERIKEISNALISEINSMEGTEKRSKRSILSEIKELNSKLA
tara:strand:+ start:1543 stop:2274 length:732 start_codon:yes stop_codon:yes gene_type:complete